ncbi:hypothetical protein I8751_29135 [Nostocaceae cyanobacterium CENA357]|uniref:Uncharacterized protein n=1 Tax=Atlanticothrix silvestris CENA357 TaxID=1725252 RepID=A0A8J7HJH0_9CYAN|nr:hypothetical protein [Atlanticothrix silvestris]MBH8556319.1 hypothetical protein [Atlanticothrix silvestris CENA357]
MANSIYNDFVDRYKYVKPFGKNLHIQSLVIWRLGIWALLETNLQAAQRQGKVNLFSNSSEQFISIKDFKETDLFLIQDNKSYPIIFLKQKPLLITAPENFNPGLQLSPPVPPKIPDNLKPPSTSTEPVKPFAVLENLQIDFRNDTDNFGQHNLFIEPTFHFKLHNGNKIFFKTGLDFFEQRDVESVTNIPLQIGWQGKVGQVTLQTAAGIDVFNRLPTAINFNAKVEAPIFPPKVSSSGRLISGLIVSANLEQSPYKFNAQT